MCQPGDLVLLYEVVVLQGVQLASAPSHDVTVSRDHISHVKVVNVFNQVGSIHLCFTIWFMSMLFEARSFNMVIFDNVRSDLRYSCS